MDTNVLVSGLLSPYGASGELVRMTVSGMLELLYDARILSEYEEVLTRPKFSFSRSHVRSIIEYIENSGIPVAAGPVSGHLPDREDEAFLAVVVSGKAECLITGNVAHFPIKPRGKVKVLAPRQFINRY